MNFIFRLDSSSSIGSGHVYRCIKLAEQLSKNQNKVSFVAQSLKGNINLLIKKKYRLDFVKKNKNFRIKKNHYIEWSKKEQIDDANKTLKITKKLNAKFVIVDHYGLSHHWHKILKKHLIVIAIDDFLNKKFLSDIYINYQSISKKKLKLNNILNKNCKILLGPKYALLRKIKQKNKKKTSKKNILIYFGNVDRADMTKKIVNLMSNIRIYYKFFVIIGKNNKSKNDLLKIGKKSKNFFFITKVYKNLNDFYEKCFSAITGTGVTLYELIQNKRNIISIYSNKYQKKLVENLEKEKICKVFNINQINNRDIQDFISEKKRKRSHKKNYFDGLGPYRIYQLIKKLNNNN